MKIEDFIPTFHNVWLKEVRPEKTSGGLIIPERGYKMQTFSPMFENDKEHEIGDIEGAYFTVVSSGPNCTQGLHKGDRVLLMNGARREPLVDFGKEYSSVSENQIIGREIILPKPLTKE